MKVICNTCGRTARGNIDELIDLGWSRAKVTSPFRRTFTACWLHGGEMLVDLCDAFADVPKGHRLVRLIEVDNGIK